MSTRKSTKQRKPARKAVIPQIKQGSLGNPFPASTDLKFTYYDQVGLDATSGTPAHYLFSANGMFDPDITGTGHQPLGFDQWLGLFYNAFCVYKSEIKVTFMSQNAAGSGQAVCLVGLIADSSVTAAVTTIREQPTYVAKQLGSIGSGKDTITITKKCDVAQFFGLGRKELYADSTHRGTSSANPADTVLYDIVVSANNASVNPDNVVVLVEVIFWAHLTERRQLAAS